MHRALDTPTDLKARLDAERAGLPFLVFRDPAGGQRIVTLESSQDELTVGRAAECDVRIDGDVGVSRLHAVLVHGGGAWTVDDSGYSRNGTFVRGKRVQGHRVLRDRDTLRVGTTEIRFFDPTPQRTATVTAHGELATPAISAAQRKVLIALCRPFRYRTSFARAASNAHIARELCLSEETVRTHLRMLFVTFGLEDVAPSEKRVRLAEAAFLRGAVSDSDFGPDEPDS